MKLTFIEHLMCTKLNTRSSIQSLKTSLRYIGMYCNSHLPILSSK